MIFNKSKKYDFPPELAFENGELTLGMFRGDKTAWNPITFQPQMEF